MSSLRHSIDQKVEKFIVERESFKSAVGAAFQKYDLDGNGVIAPKELTAMSDTMFDLVEKELKDYGLEFAKPTPEQVQEMITAADFNHDYVLNQDEFFEFYRQVVKYCAVMNDSPGLLRKYLPPMLCGLAVAVTIKKVVEKVPALNSTLSAVLSTVPVIVAGPVLGLICAYSQKESKAETKAAIFKKMEKKPEATTSKPTE